MHETSQPPSQTVLHSFDMDRYQKQEKGAGDIGKGAYGVVYKGTDRQTGKTVAMKVCQIVTMN